MVEIIKDIRGKINYDGLNMRIGIHTVLLHFCITNYLGFINWRHYRNRSRAL